MIEIVALKQLDSNDFTLNYNNNMTYKDKNIDNIIDTFFINFKDNLTNYFGENKMVVKDTFNYNLNTIFNRNYMVFAERLIDISKYDEVDINDFLVDSKIVITENEDTTVNKLKNETDGNTQSITRTETIDNNVKNKRADNPNTTPQGELINDYITEADESTGTSSSSITDTKEDERTIENDESIATIGNKSHEQINESGVINRINMLMEKYPSLANAYMMFMNNFKSLFIIGWYNE